MGLCILDGVPTEDPFDVIPPRPMAIISRGAWPCGRCPLSSNGLGSRDGVGDLISRSSDRGRGVQGCLLLGVGHELAAEAAVPPWREARSGRPPAVDGNPLWGDGMCATLEVVAAAQQIPQSKRPAAAYQDERPDGELGSTAQRIGQKKKIGPGALVRT
jgi:hypothetical protein